MLINSMRDVQAGGLLMLPKLKHVDDPNIDHAVMEKLRRLMAPEAFQVVLESFLDRSRIHMGNAERCLAEGDLEKLKFTVHSLKGSSANIGLTGLSQLCASLEKQIKQGAGIEALRPQFEQTCIEFEAARQYLLSLTQELAKAG